MNSNQNSGLMVMCSIDVKLCSGMLMLMQLFIRSTPDNTSAPSNIFTWPEKGLAMTNFRPDRCRPGLKITKTRLCS